MPLVGVALIAAFVLHVFRCFGRAPPLACRLLHIVRSTKTAVRPSAEARQAEADGIMGPAIRRSRPVIPCGWRNPTHHAAGTVPDMVLSRFLLQATPQGVAMAYLAPSEFVTKMIDAGESKIFMSTRDTVIRAYMAGAILALAAWFAITINVQTGNILIGALLFPVGFCMLNLLGFDLLTGVFVLTPLAWLNKRPGVTIGGVLRNWGLVFVGNFAGALTTAFLMAFVTTFGFT
ncbi:MAG TPA: formate/nitrite transporter family protein, partial [Bradyrhizobium sp.]|nr:formate/nitrite transporter family protein [Bradyrhizobium sp.]